MERTVTELTTCPSNSLGIRALSRRSGFDMTIRLQIDNDCILRIMIAWLFTMKDRTWSCAQQSYASATALTILAASELDKINGRDKDKKEEYDS